MQNKSPYIFTLGNIKGGAGKTTFSMHLISGLMNLGFKVASIDTDVHQKSLTAYIDNRVLNNKDQNLPIPHHYHIKAEKNEENLSEKERIAFEEALEQAKQDSHIIVIDTPGSFCNLSCLAHSYADTIITPMNDSFLDLDLLANVDSKSFKITKLSTYSEMVWKQKLNRAKRDQGIIKWVIARNRLSNLDAKNKRAVANAMKSFEEKLKCTIAQGFSERVIFRELFLKGLTLLDLKKTHLFTVSHIAARQEVRQFMDSLDLDILKDRYLG